MISRVNGDCCWDCRKPPKQGSRRCEECAEKHRVRNREHYAKVRASRRFFR